MNDATLLTGDCRDVLPTLEAESVQCCVTSPPYWALRDYGTASWEGGDAGCDHRKLTSDQIAISRSTSTLVGGQKTNNHEQDGYSGDCPRCGAKRIDSQLGLESTPEEYVAKMVAVFREVWRVLRNDGTLWVNMGDSYAHGIPGGGCVFENGRDDGRTFYEGDKARGREKVSTLAPGLKPKDLCGIPWRLAFALQADGWYLRSDIIWHKPNPMPESVTDRPTKSHEYIFLLTKQERYFYDADAIREPQAEGTFERFGNGGAPRKVTTKAFASIPGVHLSNYDYKQACPDAITPDTRRNKRSVWTVATQPYAEAHFATFPEDLIKPCILAGSRLGDTILDPFAGSGTTGKVALELGRKSILIELNPDYVALANDRTFTTPGFL